MWILDHYILILNFNHTCNDSVFIVRYRKTNLIFHLKIVFKTHDTIVGERHNVKPFSLNAGILNTNISRRYEIQIIYCIVINYIVIRRCSSKNIIQVRLLAKYVLDTFTKLTSMSIKNTGIGMICLALYGQM